MIRYASGHLCYTAAVPIEHAPWLPTIPGGIGGLKIVTQNPKLSRFEVEGFGL